MARPYNPYRTKYHNRKVERDGIIFDSTKEAKRYTQLKELEEQNVISNLDRQVVFELIPAQYGPDTVDKKGKTKKGKLLERRCTYIADFTYIQNGELIVEDTKGMRLSDYIIKRKLMLWVHGIKINEI